MNLFCRIKGLCETRDISIARLEQETGLANGSIRKWEKVLPSSDRLERVADYFNVTTDYLLGRSVKCIIDDRLKEKNMSFEDLAEKTGVSLHWLKNLESFIPGGLGYDHEIGYKWVTDVAIELGLDDKKLRAALARQEAPVYDGPAQTYEDAVRDFSDPSIKEESASYITLAANRVDGYDEPLTEDEADAVKAFLETYRKMKRDKEG